MGFIDDFQSTLSRRSNSPLFKKFVGFDKQLVCTDNDQVNGRINLVDHRPAVFADKLFRFPAVHAAKLADERNASVCD